MPPEQQTVLTKKLNGITLSIIGGIILATVTATTMYDGLMGQLREANRILTEQKTDISVLKTDITALKTDVSVLKSNPAILAGNKIISK